MVASVAKMRVPDRAVFHEEATVVAVDAATRRYVVENDNGSFSARRAVSCLLEPVVRDVVIVAFRSTGTDCYVTSVIERPEAGPTVVSGEGDVVVKSDEGKVVVTGARGVDVLSSGEVSMTAARLGLTADEGSLVFRTLAVAASALSAEVTELRSLHEKVDIVVERIKQNIKRSYRLVEEIDHVRAGALDYAAKKLLRLHGKNSVVTAEELAKIDGEQVHIG